MDALDLPPFVAFPSISRLARDVIVTEKIDGANAMVHVAEDGRVIAGSRNRWVPTGTKGSHFGFEKWVAAHEDELRAGLGVGTHYGEWWGSGIQRGYGLVDGEKRFSLFNVGRWFSRHNFGEATAPAGEHTRCIQVPCCHVVPVLLRFTFDTNAIETTLDGLVTCGSVAAPGFMKPEGIVVFHSASQALFKKTLDKNDGHKGAGR